MNHEQLQKQINATYSAWDRLTSFIHATLPARTRTLVSHTSALTGKRGF